MFTKSIAIIDDDPETDLGALDVETASDNVFRGLLSSFGSDAKVIEDQSYIYIGGHSGQTFLISFSGNNIKGHIKTGKYL